ncbi:hypothetical protein GCM10009678_18050 [Actinomadura kijaniata]
MGVHPLAVLDQEGAAAHGEGEREAGDDAVHGRGHLRRRGAMGLFRVRRARSGPRHHGRGRESERRPDGVSSCHVVLPSVAV